MKCDIGEVKEQCQAVSVETGQVQLYMNTSMRFSKYLTKYLSDRKMFLTNAIERKETHFRAQNYYFIVTFPVLGTIEIDVMTTFPKLRIQQ